MNQSKAIEITKEIISYNPLISLSGSLSLNLQNVRTRRQPKDLDFYIPFNILIIDSFMKESSSSKDGEEGSESDESYFERNSYYYKGISIDIFQPIDNEFRLMTL